MSGLRKAVSAACVTFVMGWSASATALPAWLTLRGDSCASRFDTITVERLMQLNLPEDVDSTVRVDIELACAEAPEDPLVISVAHPSGEYRVERSLTIDAAENSAERTVSTLAGEILGDWLIAWDRREAALRGAGRTLRDATILSRGVAASTQVGPAPDPEPEAFSRAGWFAEVTPAGSTMANSFQAGVSAGAAYRDTSWLGYGFGAEWVSGGFDTTIGALTTRRVTLDAHLAFALFSDESPWYLDPVVGAKGGVLWSSSTSFDDFYEDRTSVLGWVSPFGRLAAGRRLFDPVWLGVTVEGGYPALGGVIDALDERFDYSLPWASAGLSLRVGPL